MALKKNKIVILIKALKLSPDRYIVFGGAALALRGKRGTGDIDMLSAEDLIIECKNRGDWEDHLDPTEKKKGIHHLPPIAETGNWIELFPNEGGRSNLSFQELWKNVEMIDGIPVCGVDDLKTLKRYAYEKTKDPKHLKDIELLNGNPTGVK